MLHGRQLPVLAHCDSFVGSEATAEREAYCTHCSKHVHNLSRMTEREVIGFLARHIDEDVCISYRMRPDGSVELASRRPLLAPAALALSLAGCAGHLGSSGTTEQGCIDVHGYDIACPPKQGLGVAVIPDGDYAVDSTELDEYLAQSDDGPAVVDVPADVLAPEANETITDEQPVAQYDGDAMGGRSELDPRVEAERMCHPSERALREIDRSHMFRRGKFAPMSAADICTHEAVQREAKRIERRERRKQARAAKR